MSAFWADGIPYSLENDPVIRKARWEAIEYPAILRRARELDRKRMEAQQKERALAERDDPSGDFTPF